MYTKPVGLVLSGGGAKGMAYIGLLKLIDSLDIRVDYVTGTSMGGLLGGLYAIGYSGKQLEDIIMHTQWNRVLTNRSPLTEINIEEKDEYGNYMIELPVTKIKPGLPGAALKGEYLMEVLNNYTYNARADTDFLKFPIPVTIMASDILTGTEVMQRSGSLPMALRSTMAIPAIFDDVYNKGRLLVDGGLVNNFPVQEAKDMGAGFIIGGYTGFRILDEAEIENPLNMIIQTYAFNSVEAAKGQMALTDILFDYTTYLLQYSSSEFSKFKEIMQEGEIAARQKLPELIKLATAQKQAGIINNRKIIGPSQQPALQYNYVTDRGEPLTDPAEIVMLQHLTGLEPNKYYPAERINEAMHRISGTRFYEKVYYTFDLTAQGLEMNVHLKKGRQGHFKAAIHYDTEQAAGILLNYTYYNLFFNRSRFVATLDAAERMKARLNYYKFLSPGNKFWVKPALEYRNLKSTDLALALTSASDFTSPPPDYFIRTFTAGSSFGYSLTTSAYMEAGIDFEAESVHMGNNFISKLLGFNQAKNIYRHNDLALYGRLVQNTMDAQYYPAKGNKLTIEGKFSFHHHLVVNAPVNDSSLLSVYQYLNPYSDFYDSAGLPGNIGRLTVKEEHRFKLSKKITLAVSAASSICSSTNFGPGPSGYLYLNNLLGIGGIEVKERISNFRFIGLRQAEIPAASFTALSMNVQYNVFKGLYVSPTVSYGAEVTDLNPLKNLFKNGQRWWGYGLHLGYMSIVGPVDFTISRADEDYDLHFPWRAYFSIGFKF